MPKTDDEFASLLKRIKDGDDTAVWILLDEFGPQILRTIRRSLDQSLRSKFDSLDFVQAVWLSFYRRRISFKQFDSAKELATYLTQMARHKVIDETRRRLQLAKYNLNRESNDLHTARKQPSTLPAPADVAVASELWSRLLDGEPEHYQRIIELRRYGHTYSEIGEILSISERTARRVIEKVVRAKCL